MHLAFKNQGSQEELEQRGYITSRLLPPEAVAELLKRFVALHVGDDDSAADDEQQKYGKLGEHAKCTASIPDVEYRRRANNLLLEFCAPYVDRIFEGHRIIGGNFFVKPPDHKGYLAAHHHPPMLADPDELIVTIWCPLVDTDASNGTLQVIEGSHRSLDMVQLPHMRPVYGKIQDALFEKYMKPLVLKAGECVIFEDSLIHGSLPNHTAFARPAVMLSCAPADAELIFYFLDRSNPSADFEVYSIDDNFFVEYTDKEMVAPTPGLRRIGTAPNCNRDLSEAEFAELLEKARASRRPLLRAVGDR